MESIKEENAHKFKKELGKLKAYHYAYIPSWLDRLKGKVEKHWIMIGGRWGKWGLLGCLDMECGTMPWKIPAQPISVSCCTEEDAWEDAWFHYKHDPTYFEKMVGLEVEIEKG